MPTPTSKHPTRSMVPGTPLDIDWGAGRCQGKAIVVGMEHALVLSPEQLDPGTSLDLTNNATGDTAPEQLSAADVALFELRSGTPVDNRFDAVSIDGGLLRIRGLAPGDYRLVLRPASAADCQRLLEEIL